MMKFLDLRVSFANGQLQSAPLAGGGSIDSQIFPSLQNLQSDYKVTTLHESSPIPHVVFMIGSRLLLGLGICGCFSGVLRFLAYRPRGVKHFIPCYGI